MIAGNGREMDGLGWAIFKIRVCDRLLYHSFGVVREFPVEVLIGGEFLKAHGCSLTYVPDGNNRLELGSNDCPTCRKNRTLLRKPIEKSVKKYFKQGDEVRIRLK